MTRRLKPQSAALSVREREVLVQVAHGRIDKEIAAALNISAHTVKFHLDRLYKYLGVSTRTAVAVLALKRGLVMLDEIDL
ncbi:MAG: helix-turn-helix transcriptional regulator [Minisyncoccia bacterium]